MRRPDGFDHRVEQPAEPEQPVEQPVKPPARTAADEVREVIRLDTLRRRREQAAQPGREDQPSQDGQEPRRWALSAYADLDDDEQASTRTAETAAVPAAGPSASAEGGSNAQRVDRAWRLAQREQRRLDREELADTKREAKAAKRARIRKERAEVKRFTADRRRQVRVALLTAGGLVLALLVLVGLVWSPLMSVREIEVEGAERIDPAAVQEALADQVGQPIATVSEAGIAERLQTIPQIESFRVDIVPPSTVIVRLVERRPVAIIGTDAGASVIDAAGVVLGPVDATTDALPQLSGIEVGSEQFEAVATVLVSVPSDVLATTANIEAPTASDIRLTLTTGQTVQWGGAEQSALKADVVAALLATQNPSAAAVLDVRAPEHPVVRGS